MRPNAERDLAMLKRFICGASTGEVAQEYNATIATVTTALLKICRDIHILLKREGTYTKGMRYNCEGLTAIKVNVEYWDKAIQLYESILNDSTVVTLESPIHHLKLENLITNILGRKFTTVGQLRDHLMHTNGKTRLPSLGKVLMARIVTRMAEVGFPVTEGKAVIYDLVGEFTYHEIRVRLEISQDEHICRVSYWSLPGKLKDGWGEPSDVKITSDLREARRWFEYTVDKVISNTSFTDVSIFGQQKARPAKTN